MEQKLQEAKRLIQAGEKPQAQRILISVIKDFPKSEKAWLLLSFTFSDIEKQVQSLKRVLKINPNNQKVIERLAKLSSLNNNHEEKKSKSGKRNVWSFIGLFVLLAGGLYIGGKMIVSEDKPLNTSPKITENVEIVVTSTLTNTQDTQEYMPDLETATCEFTPPGDINVSCGFVIVPEDRSQAGNHMIKIAFVIFHAENPSPDPVIFLEGGPGGSGISYFENYGFENVVAPIIQERDFIVFDQRGVGKSTPNIDCPEIKDVYVSDLIGALTSEDKLNAYEESFISCRDRLTAQGINVAAYTSSQSAADIRDLTIALGYQELNLFGSSYGTRLAQTVMRDYPEIVRSSILDSTLPINTLWYNDASRRADEMLDVLFEACRKDHECNLAYPNVEQVYLNLLDQVEESPIHLEVFNPLSLSIEEVTITRISLINAVSWAMHAGFLTADIPREIMNVSQGDYTFLEAYLALSYNSISNSNLGLRLSINCHEQVYASTPEEINEDLSAYPRVSTYGFSGVFGAGENVFAICDSWGAAPFDPIDSYPIVSDIPSLVIHGELDPTTPPRYAEQILPTFNQSYYFEFPGMGHAPGMSNNSVCPMIVILEFLQTPNQEPSRDCINDMDQIKFTIPLIISDIQLEPFTDIEYGLSGLKPEDWDFIGSGFYNRNYQIDDPTQIGFQSANVTVATWVTFLYENFQGVGLDIVPIEGGVYETDSIEWILYNAEFNDNPVDIAWSQVSEDKTIMVVLLSKAVERDEMMEHVFFPILDAITSE